MSYSTLKEMKVLVYNLPNHRPNMRYCTPRFGALCVSRNNCQETKRRLVEAGLADSVDDERLDDPEALLHSSMSASAKKKFASFDLKVRAAYSGT